MNSSCPFWCPEAEKSAGNVWNTFFQTAGFGLHASEQYASVFKAQEMEIDMIPELSHELLLQMGFTKAGARIKILRLRDVIVARQTGESTSKSVSAAHLNIFGPCHEFVGLTQLCPYQKSSQKLKMFMRRWRPSPMATQAIN